MRIPPAGFPFLERKEISQSLSVQVTLGILLLPLGFNFGCFYFARPTFIILFSGCADGLVFSGLFSSVLSFHPDMRKDDLAKNALLGLLGVEHAGE